MSGREAGALRLAGATTSRLHKDTFDAALRTIDDHGLREVELTTSAPRLETARCSTSTPGGG
jgi:hypothetical protein